MPEYWEIDLYSARNPTYIEFVSGIERKTPRNSGAITILNPTFKSANTNPVGWDESGKVVENEST
jgi:hypothetical protein